MTLKVNKNGANQPEFEELQIKSRKRINSILDAFPNDFTQIFSREINHLSKISPCKENNYPVYSSFPLLVGGNE